MAQEIDEEDQNVVQLPAVLNISPKKFEVELTLNRAYQLELKLENCTNSVVAFKVKTTAPKRYTVRPTQDYVNPGESKTVIIKMGKMTQFPDPSQPKLFRDKFLVQSLALSGGHVPDLLALWRDKEAEHDPKSGHPSYHEYKIKCKLNIPAADRAAAASERGAAEAEKIAQQEQGAPTSMVPNPQKDEPKKTESEVPSWNMPVVLEEKKPVDTSPLKEALRTASPPPAPKETIVMQKTVTITAPPRSTSLDLNEVERKARQYDELLEFTTKLTDENERRKEENRSLQDRLRSALTEKEKLQSDMAYLQTSNHDLKDRLDTQLRQRTSVTASALPSSAATDMSKRPSWAEDSSSEESRVRRGAFLELWQLILLVLVSFLLGYFFS